MSFVFVFVFVFSSYLLCASLMSRLVFDIMLLQRLGVIGIYLILIYSLYQKISLKQTAADVCFVPKVGSSEAHTRDSGPGCHDESLSFREMGTNFLLLALPLLVYPEIGY